MQPLKLIMRAFGPYRDTEIIDFHDLKGQQLFVISGNTGAGKTTIFDGISFALYGNASGEDRENQAMLRSQFAADDVHTAVELVFSLKGKTYRIFRQLGHIKQGNKTKTGERYEFYEIRDQEEYPCVDRQIVSEINAKVEHLLGLTQDQFKQIVMLPQGEFRKLLTSETENKEAILRRLFKTEPYKQIGEKLRIRKKKAEEALQRKSDQRDHYMQHVYASLPKREASTLFQVLQEEHYNTNQVLAGLEEEIVYYEEKLIRDETTYKQLESQQKKARETFYAAKSLNEQFEELMKKTNKWKQLQAQQSIFQDKEKELQLSVHATQIKPYEQQVKNQKQEQQGKLRQLEIAIEEEKQGKYALKQAEKIYREQEGKKEEREAISKRLTRLEEFLPTVRKINQTEKEIQQLKEKAFQTKKRVQEARIFTNEKEKRIQELRTKMKEMNDILNNWPAKLKRRNKLHEQVKLMKKYMDRVKEEATIVQQGKHAKKAYLKAQEVYQQIENNWLQNQASVLASQLQDGKSCPVCGSTHHPQKAAYLEQEVTKEEVEKYRKVFVEKEDDYKNIIADWKSTRSILEELKQEIVELGVPVSDISNVYPAYIEEEQVLSGELKQLEEINQTAQKSRLEEEKQVEVLKKAEEKSEQLKKLHQNEQMEYSKALATYQERIRMIPEDVRVLSFLEKQIKEIKEQKITMEGEWEQAQKQLQAAKENIQKINANVKHAKNQVEEAKGKYRTVQDVFHSEFKKRGFATEEVYHQAKRTDEEQHQLQQELNHYKEHVITISKRVEELKKDLEGKEKQDLNLLEKSVIELKESYEKAFQTWNDAKAYYLEAQNSLKNIQKAQQKVEDQEKNYQVISDLHNMLRGQNDQKISFERYLQMEYLEQIIYAANERLHHLSNGQFMLMRSDRQESHGRQSGLALDVYDAYTGQNRDVKTLSGGEKFNASLCLALGMSDVVQSYQGNVSIQTMFIDEGFGSLDEESLHKAIDTLIELQESGRMIGVISHVKDLKDIFPAVLEVKKTKEGYSETEFILK